MSEGGETTGARAPHRPSTATAFLYGTCSVWLLTLLSPLFIIPLVLYRWLLQLSAVWLRPDLSHMLRAQGGVFLCHAVHREPRLNIIVNFQLDGPLDVERFKGVLQGRLLKAEAPGGRRHALAYPELQQHCVKWGGYFFWTQEIGFSVDNHVREQKLEEGEDLAALKCRYVREPLPARKSPWQVLVVEPAQAGSPSTSTHLLFKYHHSLADGFSMMQAFLQAADAPAVTLDPSQYAERSQGRRWYDWLTLPLRAMACLPNFLTVRTPLLPWPRIPAEPYACVDADSVHGGASRSGGPGRQNFISSGAWQAVSMELVKAVARRQGVCVTAVLYAAAAGAVRAQLLAKYGVHEIRGFIRFLQPVPVLLHPEGLSNSVCTVTFLLPIGEPDPAARLQACQEMIQDRKRSAEFLLTFAMLQVASWLPYNFPLRYRPGPGGTCFGVTNIPGPLQAVGFLGRRVLAIGYQGVATPLALYLGFISYNGMLRWACNGDTRVFTERGVEELARGVREEFDVLDSIPVKAASRSKAGPGREPLPV